jgi:hypothetical protein
MLAIVIIMVAQRTKWLIYLGRKKTEFLRRQCLNWVLKRWVLNKSSRRKKEKGEKRGTKRNP